MAKRDSLLVVFLLVPDIISTRDSHQDNDYEGSTIVVPLARTIVCYV